MYKRWHGTSEDWIDYADVKSCCKEEGLNDFIDLIEEKGIQTHNIVPVFENDFIDFG